jgi:HrpA-like RNA helicase
MCSQSRYESVLQGRKNLPMFKARESFLNELKSSENKTLIVVGDTG